jgi:hypothetical protein
MKPKRCKHCNMPKPDKHKPKDGECPVKLRHTFVAAKEGM